MGEGTEKPLRTLGGVTMLERAMTRLGPQVNRIVLSANGDPERFARFGLPVVADELGVGPLAGLLAGMRWSERNAPEVRFVASVASDTPFFPADLVARLSEGCGRDENTVALAASPAGTHPVFGLWPVKLADGLQRFLENTDHPKVLSFADRFMRLNVVFDDIVLADGETVDPFFNVNTREDAARADALLPLVEAARAGAPLPA